MCVIRVEKTKNYTVMSNYHLRDKNLSLKAKGLLSVMLSLPEDWDYTIKGLVAILKESSLSVESALKELKCYGYVTVIKMMPDKTKSGKIEYQYIIREMPENEQKDQKQEGGNQPLDNQEVENQVQISTKELNTENKDKEYIGVEKEVIDFLNQKTNSRYRLTDAYKEMIHARIKENFTLDDFKKVITNKALDWIGTDMEKYLRPQTLFSASKFQAYLNEKPKKQEWKYSDMMPDYMKSRDVSNDPSFLEAFGGDDGKPKGN
jgi:uncharacterized phage protein (TIGR02220 family)